MILRRSFLLARLATFVTLISLPGAALAITVRGTVDPLIPSGQFMSMTMTIDDTTTRFELTGPDYSWFAFGFDTDTMFGYSLIIEGLDGDRTAVEQNLQGIGSPGDPQLTQNIDIVSTTHDELNELTTIVIERANNTGDADDAVFSPNMGPLQIIGAYDSFSGPGSPSPFLSYHGQNGRGFGVINFSIIPEPTGALLASMAASMMFLVRSRRAR